MTKHAPVPPHSKHEEEPAVPTLREPDGEASPLTFFASELRCLCRRCWSRGVLHRGVGGPDIMRDQLAALLTASEHRNISIQVVPKGAYVTGGAIAGLEGGFFIASAEGSLDSVFVESAAVGHVTDHPRDVAAICRRYEAVRSAALPARASADLHSEGDDGMAADLTGATWRKSSLSGSSGGECVEVAVIGALRTGYKADLGALHVMRDSREPRRGRSSCSPGAEWDVFIAGVKLFGEFDHLGG